MISGYTMEQIEEAYSRAYKGSKIDYIEASDDKVKVFLLNYDIPITYDRQQFVNIISSHLV